MWHEPSGSRLNLMFNMITSILFIIIIISLAADTQYWFGELQINWSFMEMVKIHGVKLIYEKQNLSVHYSTRKKSLR